MSHLRQEAPLLSDKIHAFGHGERLPEGSDLVHSKCLPLVSFFRAKKAAMEIGHRIARARTLAGLSQTELAQAAGVTRGLVGQWESHKKKPGRENLARIARITMVSMPYLMGEETQEEMRLVVTDPEQIDILRLYARLTDRQRQNFRQLLGMSVEIRKQIEKQSSPAEGEKIV